MKRLFVLIATAITLLSPGSALGFDWGAAYNSATYSSAFYDSSDFCVSDISGAAGSASSSGCCSTTISTGDVPTGSGGTQDQHIETAFRYFMSHGLTASQSAGILGNLIQESGVDPGSINTAGGTGGSIAQWEGPRWTEFLAFANRPEEGSSHDLVVQLDFMWAELTGTKGVSKQPGLAEIKATSNPSDAAVAFEHAYERADPRFVNMPNRIKQAGLTYNEALVKGWDQGNALVPDATTTSGTAAACATGGSGIMAGDIDRTAIGLAWPKPDCVQAGRGSCYDPTPAYRAAAVLSIDYTDCGIFVATVMVKSGADPSYPHIGTATQLAYVTSHPEKYTITRSPTTAQLHPGDVLVVNNTNGDHHTEIYAGADGGKYPVVAASQGSHTPEMSNSGSLAWMLNRPALVAATLIK
ncbi:MAG TPA: phage tail tip lysozyme [Candidatus Saccharimonas sp.]|nr:phage tail tip lysozyme [Candidatus Saccharimonas sp.]